jgi:uncharacterized flavoprotein (TIGR03862 family)
MNATLNLSADIAIIGAGPAGLFAAEQLARLGHRVTVYEAMPSPGRKFLLAGRGGLNLTHSEPIERLMARYGEAESFMEPLVQAFAPDALRSYADGLGAETFTGSSGRIFPRAMKASPMLRAWLLRLNELGVRIEMQSRLTGLEADRTIRIETALGAQMLRPDAILLACGGASWPRLGSNGQWADLLAPHGVALQPFESSNAAALIAWSDPMRRHVGAPLKRLRIRAGEAEAQGEAVITSAGLEGGAIYALSPALRAELARHGSALLHVDLRPDLSTEKLAASLARQKKGETQSNALRRLAALAPAAIGLLREAGPLPRDPEGLAARIKMAALTVHALGGLDRAISTSGGIARDALTPGLMIKALPGVFAAGEMIDWDAPTGGYLLQGCFSTAMTASKAVHDWLQGAAGA